VPPTGTALTVLRPKLVWRLVLPPLLVASVAGVVSTYGDDAVTFWKGVAALPMVAVALLAAFRSRIELHPAVRYRRGPFGWSEPIAAADIEEVEFHWEMTGLPHRELRLTTSTKRGWWLSPRWWAGWWWLSGGSPSTAPASKTTSWCGRSAPTR
jgi:hypothetical protein